MLFVCPPCQVVSHDIPVEVHELEEVCAALHGHGGAEQEEHDAHARRKLAAPRPQVAGEHVHNPRHETLHDAELAVDPDRLEVQKRQLIEDMMCTLTVN